MSGRISLVASEGNSLMQPPAGGPHADVCRRLPTMNDPGPVAKRRRWWKVLAGVWLALIAAVAAIPWVLATPTGQRLLLARANRKLAPGSISWTSVGFSWF